jgi:hypothetical protein
METEKLLRLSQKIMTSTVQNRLGRTESSVLEKSEFEGLSEISRK